jgi:DNA-binding NtrC family response regulator
MSPDLRQAREELAQGPPDVIFIDLNLPDGSGLDLIAAAGVNGHLPETIMITGQASMETAVEALRNGVSDYLRPVDFARQMSGQRLQGTRAQERSAPAASCASRPIRPHWCRSPSRVCDLRQGRRSDATVSSQRPGQGDPPRRSTDEWRPAGAPALNCGAARLIGELFGHDASFTGVTGCTGYFERANRGTLFWTRSRSAAELQVKLLRVLRPRP